MERLNRLWTTLGPSMPRPTLSEALRAALGAAVGLFVTGCLLWLIAPTGTLLDHPLLIAPFAASAVLIFAVPNSPLAQPWAVVVGNTASALCGLALLRLVPDPLPAAALAVLAAIAVTTALRALHPPGGATAMAVVLSAAPGHVTGWGFAILPVLIGSVLLTASGLLWNRLTGREYPTPARPAAAHATTDKSPDRRLAPDAAALAGILHRLRLGANLGIEDLARILSTAEAASATVLLGQISAADLMSRDLITALPDTALPQLAELFRAHRVKSLPIRHHDGSYGGIVPIAALVGINTATLNADDLVDRHIRTAEPGASVADLIALLSDGRQQIVPVVQNELLLGLVTRSDLIALLIHTLGQR